MRTECAQQLAMSHYKRFSRNTRNLLKRKNMHLQSYNRVLCSNNVEETLTHLFWDCTFELNCWSYLFPNKKRGSSSYDELCLMAQLIPAEIALDTILMGCWSIWSIRNDKIFHQAPAYPYWWKFYLREGLNIAKIKIPLRIKIFMWFVHKQVILTKDNLANRRWEGSK
jgi:hypothetical protein